MKFVPGKFDNNASPLASQTRPAQSQAQDTPRLAPSGGSRGNAHFAAEEQARHAARRPGSVGASSRLYEKPHFQYHRT